MSELPDSVINRGGSVTEHDATSADEVTLGLLAGVTVEAEKRVERVPRPVTDIATGWAS